jgi:hypothetical protein
MRAVLTEPFAANLIASPPEVQKAFGKQLTNLLRVALSCRCLAAIVLGSVILQDPGRPGSHG